MPKRRHYIRNAALGLAVLIALIVTVVGILHLPSVRAYLWNEAIAYLEDEYELAISASRIRYNLATFTFTLDDFTLASAARPEMPRFLAADRMAADLDFWRLVGGTISIDNASIDGLNLHWAFDAEGRSNFPLLDIGAPDSQQEQEPASDFRIEELRIDGETLTVSDAQRGFRVALPAWELTVSGSDDTHDLAVAFEAGGEFEARDRMIGLGELQADLTFIPDALRIQSLQLDSSAGRLAAEGTVSDFSDAVVDVGIEADLDLPEILAIARVEVEAQGRLETEARIQTEGEDVAARGRISATDMTLDRFESLQFETMFTWMRDENRVLIEDLLLESPDGRVEASGDFSLEESGLNTIDLVAEGVDLGELTTVFDFPVRVYSRLSGTFDGAWQGTEVESLTGRGRFTLAPTRGSVTENALPLSGTVAVDTNPERLLAALNPLNVAGATVRGQVVVSSFERLGGRINADVADIAQATTAVRRFLGASAAQVASTEYPAGVATVSAALGGSLARPQIRFELSRASVDYAGFENIAVAAAGSYRAGTLGIEAADFEIDGQTIEARGALDFAADPAALAFEATGMDLSARVIARNMGRDIPVAGTFDLEAEVRGNVDAPVVEADLQGRDLAAYGEPLGALVARVDVDLSRAAVTELAWTKVPSDPSKGTLTGMAVYAFDTEAFRVNLEGVDFEIGSLSLPEVERVQGRVDFSIEGEGTVSEPVLELNALAEEVFYGEVAVGDVRIDANLDGDRLRARTEVPLHNLAATADAEIESPYPAGVRIEIDGIDLADLDPMLPEERQLSGIFEGVLEAAGEIENWRDATARLTLAELQVNLDDREFAVDGRAVVTYESRRVLVDPFTLVAGGERLRVEGDMPLDPGAMDGAIRVRGTLDVSAVMAMIPTEEPIAADGVLEVDMGLRGNLQRMFPAFEASLREATLRFPAMSDPLTMIEADVEVAAGALVLDEARADWNGASIRATGRMPLLFISDIFFRAPYRVDNGVLEVEISDLSMSSIPGMPASVEGTASLTLDATAEALDPDAVEARIEFQSLDLVAYNLEFQQVSPVVITLAGGRARVEPFALTGPETRIAGDAEFELAAAGMVRADLEAETDTVIFSSPSGAVESSGQVRLNLAVRGTLEEPTASGGFELDDGTISVASPAIQVEQLDVSASLAPDSIVLDSLTGAFNGGTISAVGTVGYEGLELTTFLLDVYADDVFMEFPEGLRTLATVQVDVRSEGDLIRLEGTARILEGSYTSDVGLNQFLLETVVSRDEVELFTEPNPLLSRIRYDISVDTVEPVVVANNLADLETEADLRLVGSYYSPGLIGRVTIAEGGVLRLQETQFVVERGVIDFAAVNRIEPSLDILATAEVQGYEVTLQVTGGGARGIDPVLISDPPLPEPDIVALLITGRTLEEVRGAELSVAREQALSFVTGALGGTLTRGVEEALGLSRVRIEPNLIANESDPGARLTVGQNITRSLELIYSMNLTDSSDQIWIAEYDATRRFQTRAIKQEDNSYRFELRHDLSFGPGVEVQPADARGRLERVLTSVVIEPETFDGQSLAEIFDVEAGDEYDFIEVREATLRLVEHFVERGYLEARVRTDREIMDRSVDLRVSVATGPRVDLVFRGASLERNTTRRVRQIWQDNGFDSLRGQNAIQAIRTALIEDGYLEAEVDYAISQEGNLKTVAFEIRPGPRYTRARLDFDGLGGFFSSGDLREALEDADLWPALRTDPARVRDFYTQMYRAAGFLDVAVAGPRYEFDAPAGRARMVMTIDEGPQYVIDDIRFNGNDRVPGETLVFGIGVLGETFTPERFDEASTHVEERYWELGYNNVVITRTLVPHPDRGTVDFVFNIREGARDVIRAIEITGNRNTSENLVRTQLAIRTGEPLNFNEIADTRRNLYDTGAYGLVNIDSAAIEDADPDTTPSGDNPVRVRLNLREVPPYTLRYGGFFDTDRGAGAIADLRNQNTLGSARTLGLRLRYDGELREGRIYFSQPQLLRLPLKSNASVFLRRELQETFTTDRLGFSLQQEARMASNVLLSYGYELERARSFEPDPVPDPFLPPFDVTVRIASVRSTLSRDTRDDLLDASRGSFTSHALEYGTDLLGSDLSLIKYFGQFFRYRPISEPSEIPFSGGVRKSRFVYAGGVRLGLAIGLQGDPIVPSEKFFAGGGTTLRGFEQDRVGPLDFAGDPVGGDAVFIMNHELRFPLYSFFDGVGFLDIGNVYDRVADFDPFDVRSSAGFGLRVRTPWFLLRADYGLNLDRRPGEPAGTFFFSIGQAF